MSGATQQPVALLQAASREAIRKRAGRIGEIEILLFRHRVCDHIPMPRRSIRAGGIIPEIGGCGFIGSNFIRYLLETDPAVQVLNCDLLTYAGNPANLADLAEHPRYRFVQADIADREAMRSVFASGISKARRNASDGGGDAGDLTAATNWAAKFRVDGSDNLVCDLFQKTIAIITIALQLSRVLGLISSDQF